MLSFRTDTRRSAWLWPLVVMAAAWVPVLGAFSTTHVFHVRDLGLFFWPRHLWIRESLLDGRLPLWDPYAAAGQSAAADALNQLFFPIAFVLRFLPAVVGFNLWVALPFPVAALGTYVLLAERVSRPAAALGAIVFVASGPVVSSGNFPNFSWAVAFLPWVVWAAMRLVAEPSRRWFAVTTVFVALQALAGEPVTLFATGVLVAGWAWHGDTPRSMAARVHAMTLVGAAGVLAVCLAAVQLVPLAVAAAGSTRAGFTQPDLWSLHPLALVETVAPHFFGDTYEASYDRLAWVPPLNSDREPLLFSLYIGVAGLLLALHGAGVRDPVRRRWARTWAVVVALALAAALGTHTPIYLWVQALVPPLQSLRFPVKYLVVAMLGIAALVALGCDRLREQMAQGGGPRRVPAAVWTAAGIASMAAAVSLLTLLAPGVSGRLFAALAAATGVEEVADGAAYLAATVPPFFLRLSVLAVSAGGLLALAAVRRREAGLAIAVLCGLVVADPLVANGGMHPTMPASLLGPPAWVSSLADRDARVYVGGKITVGRTMERLDGVQRGAVDAEHRMIDAQSMAYSQYALTPSAWGLREIVSYDLPQLWPVEYHQFLKALAQAGREDRLRVLAALGVRYCVLPEPPAHGVRPLAEVPWLPPMAVYECGHATPRAVVVHDSRPVGGSMEVVAAVLDPSFDVRHTVLLHGSRDSGVRRASDDGAATWDSSPGAVMLEDAPGRVIVRAIAGPGGGHLVLFDSYDSAWQVQVNGVPAALHRANGLFRAVEIVPGEHIVEFRYRPAPVYAGGAMTLLGVFGLLVPWPRARNRARPGKDGSR